MAESSTLPSFTGGATPTVTSKKVTPPERKKVIKRLVKTKAGELIKTEIVRIDTNGEMTITSYPAGTPIPNFGSSQSAGRKPRAESPVAKESNDNAKPTVPRGDVGPSVPVTVPGLDDLLEKEKELMKAKEEAARREKDKKASLNKKLEESLETTLISIARRKRQKDPKSRRRGLVASTMSRRADSDEGDKDHAEYDSDNLPTPTNDEEEDVKRKERHRRRHAKKHREKPAAYREPNDSGIDGAHDQRPYDPEDEEQELHPLEEAELLAKQLQASATLKQQKESEHADNQPMEIPSLAEETKPQMSDISDNELEDKPKKKKKKHKSKKKKKQKKHKRRDSVDDLSEKSDRDKPSSANEIEPKTINEIVNKDDFDEEKPSKSPTPSKTLSRSSSFSSLTLSSISSDFSDSFDFAEANPMMMGDNAAMFRGGFRGRGAFNMPFRGRAMFRGFPRTRPPRGGFRGGWTGFPGMFPEGMDPMSNPLFMGRGNRGMWRGGPWGPLMGGGRGGSNNVEDGGIGIYVEEDSDSSRRRSRSYSSYSSYSSRSRSRSRRRHRRRRHSSSRSYSSYSRSSRSSYSRSYSRSSRSYSRSYSRSSSRSYSSDSRSRSRSRSQSKRMSSSDRSPHFHDIYSRGANQNELKQDEEVPWWAEFDKTYEIQKQAEQEAKALAKTQASGESGKKDDGHDVKPATKLQGTSYDFADMAKEDIDVVRTVMSLVDGASRNQDPDVEDTRRCLSELLQEVCTSTELQTPEAAADDCMHWILDQLCPDDPATVERKEKSDPSIIQFPKVAGESKLLRWYTIACHVTKQTRAMRHQAKRLADQEKSEDEKDSRSEGEQRRADDRKGRRGRRRRRRRHRRGRSYSRSSYSSSSSEKRPSLVNLTTEQQRSLQQAQQMLILQQQQLQAAGILPKSLALPLPSLFPNLIPATSTASAPPPEPEVLTQRWDKDMDALLKTKSKDDLTKKMIQRMKEKKQFGDADDSSPTFQARGKAGDALATDKVFSGTGSLKSRKIAISSIDKSKVFDDVPSYKKSDIAAAQASIDEANSRDVERLREMEQRGKLEAWSDEQKSLKEEVKRQMREEIEKAERAKKEKLKEQMLEEEKQREIMRIREEVREQIKREIREEIAKQRKEVLEDPELKSQLMELEALRQSKIPKSESGRKPHVKPLEESFVSEQDKHKQEMNLWLEKHGKRASDMSVDEMRRMQTVYMQQLHHWSQQQQKAYMQWYWHQQQHYQQHGGMYNQSGSFYSQPNTTSKEPEFSKASDLPMPEQKPSSSISSSEVKSEKKEETSAKQEATFTHAPSQGIQLNGTEGTTPTLPPRGLMSSQTEDQMQRGPRPVMQSRPPFSQHDQFNRRNMPMTFSQPNEMIPRRGPSDMLMNQQRYNMPMQQQDMQRHRLPFQNPRDGGQPIHQFPPSDFEHRKDEFQPRMVPSVSGMHGPHPHGHFERPQFDGRGMPRFDNQPRPHFDALRPHGLNMDHQRIGPMDQRIPIRTPFDQQQPPFEHNHPRFDQQPMRPPHFDQQHMRPQFDPRMRPPFDQRLRPEFDPRLHVPHSQPGMPHQSVGSQFRPPPTLNQPRLAPPGLSSLPTPFVQQQQQALESPSAEHNVAAKSTGNDQPPPPGVDTTLPTRPIPSNTVITTETEELKPPGEDSIPTPKIDEEKPSESMQKLSPEKPKQSKKKKKKHRKHKKRRGHSSTSEDDDDAQHAAILKQLEALQHVEEGEVVEVEDGEVQSDDEKKPSTIAAAARLLKQLKAREKRRHKKKKKRRKESSSDDDDSKDRDKSEPPPPSDDVTGLPPPPFFQDVMPQTRPGSEQPGQTVLHTTNSDLPHPTMLQSIPDKNPQEESTKYPPRDFRSPSFPRMQYPPEHFLPNQQGAGEPHLGGPPHTMERPEHFSHYIGPGGDHTLGQSRPPENKTALSSLPIAVPDDPRELEAWSRQMNERYINSKQDAQGKPLIDAGLRKPEKIPSLMDKFIPEPESRRIVSLTSTIASMRSGPRRGRQHPDDDRVTGQSGRRNPERSLRGRGRKRKRGGPPRNYHDWDQPADDGLIYYYSDSDNSSGWGSDKNFDDLLAKKKRESLAKSDGDKLTGTFSSPQPIHVTNTRRPSPRRDHLPTWDRIDQMGSEPQGIPVIGGAKPQPIPSLANRTGPVSRAEYDYIGRHITREDDFKMNPDYWHPNEQSMMFRGAPPPAGGIRDPGMINPWPRPTMR